MKHIVQLSQLQQLIQNRNGYLVLATGSLLLNLLLVFLVIFAFNHSKVVLVPPQIEKSFWVSSHSVSPEYLSEMSQFFMNLRFNLTPSIAENQRELLLRYVSPEAYEPLKAQLISEAEKLNKEHVSTAFYPNDIQVDAQHLLARVSGDLMAMVGTNQLAPQRVAYQLAFEYHSGRLFVKSFEEVKPHD